MLPSLGKLHLNVHLFQKKKTVDMYNFFTKFFLNVTFCKKKLMRCCIIRQKSEIEATKFPGFVFLNNNIVKFDF